MIDFDLLIVMGSLIIMMVIMCGTMLICDARDKEDKE